jgi:glutathionyl-hydroquinone reductase
MPETETITKTIAKAAPKPTVNNAISKPADWKQQKRNIILNNEVSKFTKAFRENFVTLIISALGLVAALSWNDAIKTTIDTFFPSVGNVIYKYYVAIIVTIISVVITYFLSRMKPKQS